jgi:C4-dicarboxylate-specific signal transduction histidine kinase
VLIAVLASYAALDLAGRVTAAYGRVRSAWLTGGAAAMGLGIWSMHFKGMLTFHLPVPVSYYWPTVLLSLLVAIFASAFALYGVSRQRLGLVRALIGSLIMGSGMAAMHYIGMAAMRLAAATRFHLFVVSLSVVLAIVFSFNALMLAFDVREETKGTTLRKIGSAMVMGAAISAMHYTGMASVTFMPSATLPNMSHAVNISSLGNNGIVIVTVIVLAAAMLTSSVDRRAKAELVRLNDELEHRVVERTSQLAAVNEELRREMTERQRAEEALQEMQAKLAHISRVLAMGELAAAIAHEVNQPLTAIVTNSNFGLRELATTTPNLEKLREAIAEVVDDGTRASTIISRIRALLTRGASCRAELDINEVIQEVTGLARKELTRNHVSLRTELAADLPRVLGDRVQLQQVMLNLIMNGIEAMRTVTDRTRVLLIKSAKDSEGVLIQVQDSGQGFDPKQTDRIFEPFFTTKPEGIGMGLSISRSIVGAHGGRLWAALGSPHGAVFQFTLPISANV